MGRVPWTWLTVGLLALGAASGCGGSEARGRLIGTWEETGEVDGSTVTGRVTYWPNGTWESRGEITDPQGRTRQASARGRWEIRQGDLLYQQTTENSEIELNEHNDSWTMRIVEVTPEKLVLRDREGTDWVEARVR